MSHQMIKISNKDQYVPQLPIQSTSQQWSEPYNFLENDLNQI